MKQMPGSDINLGENCQIDEDVVLGYPTGRKIQMTPLVVGDNAIIRSGSILYVSTQIGADFQTGHHVIIREENSIGNHVEIWTNTVIDYGCKLANNIKIHTNVYIPQFTTIEDDVFIAPGCAFANDKYPLSKNLQGPHLKKSVRIGVNVTLLPGVTIGENSLIGAGSVVTKDVPANVVMAGNPAKKICSIDEIQGKKDSLLNTTN